MKAYIKERELKKLSYEIFTEEDINISKVKLPVLKAACHYYKLRISGTKPILIERLHSFFIKYKFTIKIQSIFRMHLANFYVNKRGPAINNKKICNNATDFVTLEPIEDIDFDSFFSYKDKQGFIYGFNIVSLIALLRSKNMIINPYNRDTLNKTMINEIITFYNSTCFISKEFNKDNNPYSRIIRIRRNILLNTNISSVDNYVPNIDRSILITYDLNQRLLFITEARERSLEDRISQLFIEIDNLGNYTNRSWFMTLSHMQYVRLYRCLFDIWVYRGQMSYTVKRTICPFYEPFEGIFPRNIYHDNITMLDMKKACLIVMENLVYSAADIEYRRIGALHALSALTIISPNARLSLRWLYESVI